MLLINNKEYEVLSSEIKYINATYNKIKGYSILISFDIELNNIKGYINFYVDFFADKDFKNIENKKYEELPTNLDSKISMIEIFDTHEFIDFIDSIVILEFKTIQDNQIEVNTSINDEAIKLDYNGQLDIKWNVDSLKILNQ